MGKDGKVVSDAQKRATAKYEKQNYDKILLRLRKGTKDRILSCVGENGSINGFISELIERELRTAMPQPDMDQQTDGNATT